MQQCKHVWEGGWTWENRPSGASQSSERGEGTRETEREICASNTGTNIYHDLCPLVWIL